MLEPSSAVLRGASDRAAEQIAADDQVERLGPLRLHGRGVRRVSPQELGHRLGVQRTATSTALGERQGCRCKPLFGTHPARALLSGPWGRGSRESAGGPQER